MSLPDPLITALVAASLTVNQYPLERAYGLMPAFRAQGLLDPARVHAMDHAALISAMEGAGYQRGGFVPIVSARLFPLMAAILDGTLDDLPACVSEGRKDDFSALLTRIYGFGPRTAEVAWLLTQ